MKHMWDFDNVLKETARKWGLSRRGSSVGLERGRIDGNIFYAQCVCVKILEKLIWGLLVGGGNSW